MVSLQVPPTPSIEGTVIWLPGGSREIDAWISGSDQILGTGIDEYPVALTMGKIL